MSPSKRIQKKKKKVPPFPISLTHACVSLSSIFLLAARIMSSLLFLNASARVVLSALHALRFCSSLGTGSLPFLLTRDCRLYRVIRSGVAAPAFFPAWPVMVVLEVNWCGGRLGWKDGGGVSRARPPRTRSMVASTFPPFRWRSHAILRRSSWGNTEEICSTLLGSTWCRREPDAELDVEDDEGLLMNHRIARKPTTATAMSWGMLIDRCPS